MKKLIFTLIALLTGVVGAQAQNTINKTTPEGHRTFETEYTRCTPALTFDFGQIKDVNEELNVSLSCEQSDEGQSWSLGIRVYGFLFSSNSCFPKGGRMLIKLNDGEIIELTQSLDNANATNNHNLTVTHIDGQYSITEENIRKITSHTVTKVRIEIKNRKENYVFYIDFDKNNISQVVASEYGAVSKAVKTGKDYIYSDF